MKNIMFNRILAFLFDIFLISFLTVAVCDLSYLNPKKYDYLEYQEKYEKELDNIMNNLDKIEPQELINSTTEMLYNLEQSKIFNYIYYLIFVFLYYVVFQYFNNGQTIGKKLFKLKVVNKDLEKAKFIQYIPRTLINGGSVYLGINLVVLLKIILLLTVHSPIIVYYIYVFLSLISYALELTLFITLIKNQNRSFNDIVSSTKVIDLK